MIRLRALSIALCLGLAAPAAWAADPVLVIHGQDDLLIPPSEAEATHSRLPRSRLELVPGAGHLLNMEQPASFNAAVRIFLQSL